MNLRDMTSDQLRDYQRKKVEETKELLTKYKFKEANITHEEARKAAEEIMWREKHGERM